MASAGISAGNPPALLVRHLLVDRCYHWCMATAVLVLMGTGLLPVLGVKFEWLLIHWVTGLLLAVLVVAHILRSLIQKPLMDMWLSFGEIADLIRAIRAELGGIPIRQSVGKYSVAQKVYHLSSALILTAVIISGLLMLLKIDTPWWERDPYLLSQEYWGYIYVLHGLATLCLITMIIVHVYFALRPEKLFYTRSMLLGWITEAEQKFHSTAETDQTHEGS